VGLFNRGLHPNNITIPWAQIGRSGAQPVRDLWQRKDLGHFKNSFTVSVARHGVVFIKVGKPQRQQQEQLKWYGQ